MKGEVAYLYAFDVANEIDMDKARALLSSKAVPLEIRAGHTLPKDATFYRPLTVVPVLPDLLFAGRKVRANIRIYEVGALSIMLRLPFEISELYALKPYHDPLLNDGRTIGQLARDLCADACRELRAALIHPAPQTEAEAYTAFCLTDIDGEADAAAWIASRRAPIAELLTENPQSSLSDTQINDILRIQHSYARADAIVIDWDAALVIDMSGYTDNVLYVLEAANLQLEEYQVIDRGLDRQLDQAYTDIQHRRFWRVGAYAATLRRLWALRVDTMRLNDEVVNISKFFGDWHLARIYLGARERFHINQWKSSVEDRLRQIDALYTVAQSESNNLHMLFLEAIIVIFFAIDLLMMYFAGR